MGPECSGRKEKREAGVPLSEFDREARGGRQAGRQAGERERDRSTAAPVSRSVAGAPSLVSCGRSHRRGSGIRGGILSQERDPVEGRESKRTTNVKRGRRRGGWKAGGKVQEREVMRSGRSE